MKSLGKSIQLAATALASVLALAACGSDGGGGLCSRTAAQVKIARSRNVKKCGNQEGR